MNITNFNLLLQNIKNEGYSETFRRLVFRFLKINRFFILRLHLCDAIPKFESQLDLIVKEVTFNELEKIRFDSQRLPSEFFRDLISPKERCFVCSVSNEIAFISWISLKGSSGFLKIPDGDVEQNYNFCLPKFRGRALYPLSTKHIAQKLYSEGFNNIWTVIHDQNIAAIKGAKLIGFSKVSEVKRLGIVKWRAKNFEPMF
ncbi:MAG: hypothetical protein B6I30_10415 [Desulfobacteraceae bacterium 4572_187]|nr:MAG: hypothetical protein B6I30_10415 [Desulfobacteraceae bacterium 4572_187]